MTGQWEQRANQARESRPANPSTPLPFAQRKALVARLSRGVATTIVPSNRKHARRDLDTYKAIAFSLKLKGQSR